MDKRLRTSLQYPTGPGVARLSVVPTNNSAATLLLLPSELWDRRRTRGTVSGLSDPEGYLDQLRPSR